ncbi:PGG domain containing protein [Parasponia andersonii]|uniref:PGG domain containing protein n=1 Tax=Parasponia andersonii TaxID=3476 RepID=A0A2P5C043_PARAD|nr:PGG domain containing protein [Parasponia andersonii]
MPPHFFLRANKDGETPEEIFTKTHKDLVKEGGEWLTSTSTSCSVVATLIATIAFGSSITFPRGTDSLSGKLTLENQPSFELFAVSSLIALCFSVTPLIMSLAILTSHHQEKDRLK